MLELIFMLTLQAATVRTAGIQPCVYPNRCAGAQAVAVGVAQFRPCVWPNACSTQPAPVLAQFKPCVFPNRCSGSTSVL